VSTGIYGYPIEDATHIALNEIRQFCDKGNGDNVCIDILTLYIIIILIIYLVGQSNLCCVE
jgi:O-acetyl-ADP-ribose deacetylase (regulator of RNase III)